VARHIAFAPRHQCERHHCDTFTLRPTTYNNNEGRHSHILLATMCAAGRLQHVASILWIHTRQRLARRSRTPPFDMILCYFIVEMRSYYMMSCRGVLVFVLVFIGLPISTRRSHRNKPQLHPSCVTRLVNLHSTIDHPVEEETRDGAHRASEHHDGDGDDEYVP
jgi:hypothetical protein